MVEISLNKVTLCVFEFYFSEKWIDSKFARHKQRLSNLRLFYLYAYDKIKSLCLLYR